LCTLQERMNAQQTIYMSNCFELCFGRVGHPEPPNSQSCLTNRRCRMGKLNTCRNYSSPQDFQLRSFSAQGGAERFLHVPVKCVFNFRYPLPTFCFVSEPFLRITIDQGAGTGTFHPNYSRVSTIETVSSLKRYKDVVTFIVYGC
jgi:hypothetical protein